MGNIVKLFSHTDLDGYGCNIIMKALFDSDVECENLNYDKINERVKEFFTSDEYKKFSFIYITDISVNDEVAQIIDNVRNKEDILVVLLDHHPTALELNKYDWATVEIERDGEKTSGTKMLYDRLADAITVAENSGVANKNRLLDFAECVKRYDTWLWKEKYNDIKPKQFNDLFYLLGRDRFIDKISQNLKFSLATIDDFIKSNEILLELQQEKVDRFVERKNKELTEYIIHGYKVGVVYANEFISELGNRLSEMNPQYDLIAMIGENAVSYRTVKDNVDCGEFAKKFGGGGHPKASGSQIPNENKIDYINRLFNLNS
jgi:oligoribonuclease NrnB/cAMP/cGMP phosphodiesterase (DHH superfamily)